MPSDGRSWRFEGNTCDLIGLRKNDILLYTLPSYNSRDSYRPKNGIKPRKFQTNVYFGNLDMSQPFRVVHIHFLASCLSRNLENQPPKTDNSSLRQCVLSNNCKIAILYTIFFSIKLFEASSQPMKYLVHKLLQTKFRIFPHQSITCPFFRINSANFNVYYCIYITPNINSWISQLLLVAIVHTTFGDLNVTLVLPCPVCIAHLMSSTCFRNKLFQLHLPDG